MIGPHPFHAVGEKYITAVAQAADCLPLLIPVLETPLDVTEILSLVDGIFFPGSPSNVEPARYEGPASVPGTLHDPHRDATTLSLIPRAVASEVPVFGVCRGFQEMNVAMGGTLHQRVHEIEGLDDHREVREQPLEVQYGPAHEVVLEPDSVLRRLAGKERVSVNSLHWQGVDQARAGSRRRGASNRWPGRSVSREIGADFRARGAVAPRMAGDEQSVFDGAVRRVRQSGAQQDKEIDSQDVPMANEIRQFLRDHGISEVEAIIPDMAGIARGKIMPAEKFAEDEGMRLPESIFLQTVTGDYPPDTDKAMSPAEIDIILKADPKTVRRVPWAAEPTAQVIHDCYYGDGRRVGMAPRGVLRHILEMYAARGWDPVVAPELEFYLVEPNIDADYPLKPPVGRSGRAEPGRQSYSIAAVNEFDPLFDDMYQFCEDQDIEIDTLIHEDGAAQMEINLLHGNALDLADQAFLFKRTAREAALRHKMYATFMAKPHAKEPGSAMHIHQSVVDTKTRKNIFSNADGTPTPLFFSHIAGMQKYLPAAMALLAPNVNSYRRISRFQLAPINVQWGYDNRTAGLRVPASDPEARRVENRLAGADANPYIAIATSLACGFLGMVEGLQPSEPIAGSAHELPFSLPRSLDDAIRELRECEPLVRILGDPFISAYTIVKEAEYEVFLQVISSWEREHLLLNV